MLSQNPKTLNPKPIGKWAILGMKAQLEVGSVDVGLGLLSQNPKTLNPKAIEKWAILGMKAQLEVGSVDVGLEVRELSHFKSFLSKAKILKNFE